MEEVVSKYLTHNSYTVGWICALDVELAASVAILDYELPRLSQAQGDSNTYILGKLGLHNVVLTCLPAGTTGTNAAANAATNMLRSFPNIRFCLMVGIGGGAPNVPGDDPREDIRLGDVAVSCPSANSGGVLQYDFGKTMSEGKFFQTGVLNKTSIVLSNSVSTLRARHRIHESRVPKYIGRMLELNRKMQKEFSHPGLELDKLFRAGYEHPNGELTCHSCNTEALILRKSREDTNPVIHYGLIGSANQVMRHGATRDKLRNEKNIICFEMEAAGLMDVFPCLVVRGICDYADSHKNKLWQPYAAVTAAAYAKELLLTAPTSEILVKFFFNGEAIYNMLQNTLYEFNWDQLLDLLPVRGYTRYEYDEISKNYDDPEFHWALRNIDFKQWSLNEGPRVLFLTGHPSESNLNQLSSYVVGREKAAGCSVLPLFCSNMLSSTTIAKFLHICLLELVYSSPEAQRNLIIRSFFSKLLEVPRVKLSRDWNQNNFDKEIFLKYMKTILESAAIMDLVSSLKTAFGSEKQRRLLVVISKLDAIESVDEPAGCVLLLIKHLQQRNPNVKILLTSSERPENKTHLEDFLHIMYDKERKECLRSLQFDNTRYDKISKEHEGSFDWIWSHNEYKSWSESGTSRLLYIQGKPGSGKSTLMRYFNRNLLLKEPAAQQAVVARFFYSFRDGELQRSHHNMLLSIVYEILHQDESFFYHYCQTEYRAHQRNEVLSEWNYDSLKRILRSLQYYRTSKPYYLTIDAVDESEEKDRRETLGLLFELCSSMKHSVVKIIMASRPVAQVEARRSQFHNFIKLEDETRLDIYNYAQSQLRGLNSTDLLAQATAYMLQNAQGVFLWVKLISEQLIEAHEEGCSEEEVFELLQQLPTELEDFYGLMLEKMKHNKSSILHAAKLFRLVLFARRPLTVDEILHALSIPDCVNSDLRFIPSDASLEKRLPSSERVILSSGGNFLEFKEYNGNKVVQIMHQTVREFLLNPDGPVANSVFSLSETHAHIDIAVTCVRYLSVCALNTSLKGKLPSFNYWDTIHYQSYCQYLDRRPFASYAISYIGTHIDICKQDANVEHAISQLIEHLASGNAGASLLESWVGSGLHRGSMRNSNTQNDDAMNFRNEILRITSMYGFRIAAEVVLIAGTTVDKKDESGRTPLILAASNGHKVIVNLLLGGGASIDATDKNGQTCLSWAAMNGHREIVELLVETGVDIDRRDNFDQTALLRAAQHGHGNTVELLADKGANINIQDYNGRTSLSMAAINGHRNTVELLVDKGARLDIQDNYGQTSLLWAVEHNHLSITRLLVETGANIHHRNNSGQTPLSKAAELNYSSIVNLLVQNGADLDSIDRRPVIAI